MSQILATYDRIFLLPQGVLSLMPQTEKVTVDVRWMGQFSGAQG